MPKDYTKQEAIDYIAKNRTISTLYLKALGISFDSFLQFAQLPKQEQDKILDKLIGGQSKC